MSVFDDDFDPLAPLPVPPEAADEEPEPTEDDPLAAPAYEGDDAEVEEFDEADGGFSDHEKIVRVWVADGRLIKVRLSPVWFHKLPNAAALEARFRQALLLSQLRMADGGAPAEEPMPQEVLERFRDLPELSRRSLAMFDQLGKEMDERHDAVLAAHRAAPPSPPTQGRSKGVTVTLNRAGFADSVTFDRAWLDDAQVGGICTHIMIAAERAHDRHRPDAARDAAIDELTRERAVFRQALLTMFQPRDARP